MRSAPVEPPLGAGVTVRGIAMDPVDRQPSEQEAGNAGYTVHLETFEGPLDLLLHLIKQEQVDIYDIPIARITQQYLNYMRLLEELNINVAGEFVVMAATLIYIKSRMLLPPDPAKTAEELEEEDPRKELVYQLLEHQKFKAAAHMLYDRETVENSIWVHPPVEIREGEEDAITVTLFDLVKTFQDVVRRLEAAPILQYQHEQYTVEEKMDELRRLMQLKRDVKFSQFLSLGLTRMHVVVLFLAVLELAKRQEIRFSQEKAFGDILIRRGRMLQNDIEPLSTGEAETMENE
jgi:segregation and condensation protein A